MGFNEKMAEGLTASGSFSKEAVSKLIDDIVEAMGKKAAVLSRAGDGDLRLGFEMSGAQKAMNFSAIGAGVAALTKTQNTDLFAGVSFTKTGENLTIKVFIQDASTSQQKLLGFIPLSPKAVLGITTYREFLEHLKVGLLRFDDGAKIEVNPEG
jgi:hypothetical protein